MSLRRLVPVLVVVVLAAVAAGDPDRLGVGSSSGGDGGGSRADAGAPGGTRTGEVVRVVDGDTLKVRIGGEEDTVRLTGIDTPESVAPGRPVECFGKEAGRELGRLVTGEDVRLVLDREARDRYDRLLAYVYRTRDDAFVNARLVRDGFAETLEIEPNTRHADRLADLEDAARAADRGLWGACR